MFRYSLICKTNLADITDDKFILKVEEKRHVFI